MRTKSLMHISFAALVASASITVGAQTGPPSAPSGATRPDASDAPLSANYIVGPQDVLAITVWDQADLGGKFSVETDGSFTFPLIGRVRVAGRTLRAVEDLLVSGLTEGKFFRAPQVTVGVEQYRSQRVFVLGQVRTPGPYPLTGDMTLIELLALAGSTTGEAGAEAVILRARPGQRATAPADPPTDLDKRTDGVIRVDIDLDRGRASQNVQLHDGDTIYVPRAELVYVYGQVNSPGGYPLRKDTTILQALSLAGGLTDRGSTGRIRIVRVVNGKRSEIKANLEDVVRAGDTITIGERFF